MNKKILITVIILCLLIIGILSFKYIEIAHRTGTQASQIQELEAKIAGLEKQNLDQKTKIEELEKLIEVVEEKEVVGEEKVAEKEGVKISRIEINRQFKIFGSEFRNPEVQKEITMLIESVERKEELDPGSTEALNIRRKANEIFLVVKGNFTNEEKVAVEVDPSFWLRMLDVEKEELYAPRTAWAPPVVEPETTTRGLTRGAVYGTEVGIVFVVPRTATYVYLRVTDAFGKLTAIPLTF